MKRNIHAPSVLCLAASFLCCGRLTAASNDDLASRQRLSGASGKITGSSFQATKEPGEPDHAGDAGGHSVWYSWRAPEAGTVSFDTAGSDFDTLLAVYLGNTYPTLQGVRSDDDSWPDLTSNVYFDAIAGREYQIAVDGSGGDSGKLTLTWQISPPCGGPPPPAGPEPAD